MPKVKVNVGHSPESGFRFRKISSSVRAVFDRFSRTLKRGYFSKFAVPSSDETETTSLRLRRKNFRFDVLRSIWTTR